MYNVVKWLRNLQMSMINYIYDYLNEYICIKK